MIVKFVVFMLNNHNRFKMNFTTNSGYFGQLIMQERKSRLSEKIKKELKLES